MAEKTDFLIVDAPAGMTETTRAILLRADLAVCPCQPTTLDTDSTEQTLQLINQAQSVRDVQPYALLLLSKAQRNTRAKKDALTGSSKVAFIGLQAVFTSDKFLRDCTIKVLLFGTLKIRFRQPIKLVRNMKLFLIRF